MSDDFYKGMRGDSQNVSDHSEHNRGEAHQRAANEPRSTTSPHGSAGPAWSSGGRMVITGESPLLQTIVGVPLVVVGAALGA